MTKSFIHAIPKQEKYSHIEQLYCECIPYIDPDDVNTVIHNEYTKQRLQ